MNIRTDKEWKRREDKYLHIHPRFDIQLKKILYIHNFLLCQLKKIYSKHLQTIPTIMFICRPNIFFKIS